MGISDHTVAGLVKKKTTSPNLQLVPHEGKRHAPFNFISADIQVNAMISSAITVSPKNSLTENE